ncbi:hypothetical protein CP03DC29_1161B, partial [Chlamydia psittaci 03DC29]
AASS